jgi:hypothetical protein
MIALVSVPEVQIELETRPEQMQLVFALQLDLREQTFRALGDSRSHRPVRPQETDASASPPERTAQLAQITQTAEDLLSTILDERQNRRLYEIFLQREGPRAWLRDDVADRLMLTSEQSARFRKLLSGDSDRGAEGGSETPAADVLAVLSGEQQAEWRRMQGKPFKFPERGRGGLRGGDRP